MKYMQLALELAEKGRGYTNPNPMVGAVIVKNGNIIGTGYHAKYGEAHAEEVAIRSATHSVRGAEMYVNLEPCSHYGNTPPCAKLLVDSKIKKVHLAMVDPNPEVSGRGIKMLRENKVQVDIGMCEKEARKLNEIFIKYATTNRPYCILKVARTLDGKLCAASGDSKWITNEWSRLAVHKLRHSVSSVMVGVDTIIADDPKLTTRIENGVSPTKLVLDSTGRIPLKAAVFDKPGDCCIITTERIPQHIEYAILQRGAQVIKLPAVDNRPDLRVLMEKLGQMKIDSVLVEGGERVFNSCIKLADKVVTFISPKLIGDRQKMNEAVVVSYANVTTINGDLMLENYLGGFR